MWGLRGAASEEGRRRGGDWASVTLFNFPSSVNKEASVEAGEREESYLLPGKRGDEVWAFVGDGEARGGRGRVCEGEKEIVWWSERGRERTPLRPLFLCFFPALRFLFSPFSCCSFVFFCYHSSPTPSYTTREEVPLPRDRRLYDALSS